MINPAAAAFLFLTLVACSSMGPASDYRSYLARKGVEIDGTDSFLHCHGYGCRLKSLVEFSAHDWREVEKFFKNVKDAATERQAIAKAVAFLEREVGSRAGTDADAAGTYAVIGDFQHDCVDESVNTTIYLVLLTQKALLKHHDVSAIVSRLPIVGGGMGPHQTAVIAEHGTERRYAVDSWFHGNGQNPEIVPLQDWIYGWRPDKG